MPLKKTSAAAVAPAANHTLVNGLRVLEAVSAGCRAFSVAELSAGLELPKSHVHRLLRTLVESGYVAQSADTHKYRADFRLLALAGPMAEAMPLRVQGGPVLRELAQATRSDAYLAVLHQGAPLIVMSDCYRGRASAHALGVGMRLSRHASAFGKLFLALKRLPVKAEELKRLTPATITTVRGLNEELVAIRRQGFSVNRAENGAIFSFAAPVHAPTGELLGAVGLAVELAAVTRLGEESFIKRAVAAAEGLSARLAGA